MAHTGQGTRGALSNMTNIVSSKPGWYLAILEENKEKVNMQKWYKYPGMIALKRRRNRGILARQIWYRSQVPALRSGQGPGRGLQPGHGRAILAGTMLLLFFKNSLYMVP